MSKSRKHTLFLLVVTFILAALALAQTDPVGMLYAALKGRPGGQNLQGGTAASQNLRLNSTAHATKGSVRLADDGSLLLLPSTGISGAGTGSGLDADLLDGLDSSVFMGGGYNDEQAQDAVGTILVDSTTFDFTYSDATPSITGIVIDDSITNAKLANVGTSTFKGRTTAGTGSPEDLTVSQAKTLLNLTGTNSGDQTITLTSDVTGSGTGSFATTIANDAVTYAKMQNISAASLLLGRGSAAGAGDTQEIALGTNLAMSGTTLNATSGAHIIQDESTPLTARSNLDFAGAGVTVTDDSGSNTTIVTIPGGGGSGSSGGGAVEGGVHFEWTSANVVTLVPSGEDSTARVSLYDGATWKFFTILANETASTAVSGAGGMDAGAEAASTFYYLWGVGKTDGTFDMVLSISSSSPTMPAGYTFKRLLSGVPNNSSSDFVVFDHSKSGWIQYRVANTPGAGVVVLTGFTSITDTAVDLTTAIPDIEGLEYGIYVKAANTNSTAGQASNFSLKHDDANVDDAWIREVVGGSVNGQFYEDRFSVALHNGAAGSMFASWSANLGTRSALVSITGFNLGTLNGGAGNSTVEGITTGVKVVYNNANTVDMVPSGADSVARLSLYDGTSWQLFTVGSTENASLACAGTAGCLDAGSEAASTFYHLWAIGKSDGTLDTLLSLSATSPTMPATYTFNALIGGVSNDGSSNIFPFQQLSDGRFMYTGTQFDSVRGVSVLQGGTSTSFAAVDLSKAIPDVPGLVYGVQLRGANSSATSSVITFSEDSSGTTNLVTTRTLSSSAVGVVIFDIDARNTGNRATSLYYDWSVASGSLDVDIYVKWWTLGPVSGGGGAAGGGGSDCASDPNCAYLPGRAGGQVLEGGTAAGDDLTLNSTANASKGDVILASDGSGLILPTTGISGAGSGSGLSADLLDGQTGSFYQSATNLTAGSLPFARVQVSAASKLLGRGSAGGAGDMEEITVGSGLSMSGTTLSATGGGSGGHTIQDEGGDLTARGNLNFVGGGVTVTDDSGNDASVVTIPDPDTVVATADSGFAITYVDPNSVSIVPNGPDTTARLTLYDGTDWKLFEVASTETVNIACSGAASCLDTGAEAANTFYYLYAIGKPDDTFDLLLSLSATSPTMPSGYTFKLLLSGVSNSEGASSTDIMQFIHTTDGWIRYTGHDVATANRLGPNILTGGTATTPTALNLSKGVPNVLGTAILLECIPNNNNTTLSAFRLQKDNTTSVASLIWNSNLNNAGAHRVNEDVYVPWVLTATTTDSIWWYFTAATSGRTVDVYIAGFNLGTTSGGGGGGAVPLFSDDETITGTINGTNPTFTLAHDPNPDASLQLYLNGVCLKRTVGYTLSGTTLTMQSGYIPSGSDTLVAFFRY